MQLNGARRAIGVAAALTLIGTAAGCGGKDHGSPLAARSLGPHAQHQPPTCPLTGKPVTRAENRHRPAVAVKIDNIAQALPQAGLNRADLVAEELVEGGLTRLFAVFQCDSAPTVGPIRSARESDADLLALFHGSVFAYSGANPKDMPPIVAHGDAALVSEASHPLAFTRSTSRYAPHNVFASTQTLLKTGLGLRPHLHAPKPWFRYGPLSNPAKRAHSVSMTWPAASAGWTWSKTEWLRTQGGVADNLANGSRVSASNVVILNVPIASTGLRDVAGSPSPLVVTVGHNQAWVLRNGKVVKGSWRRPTLGSQLSLLDRRGHPIALAPGRTWIELLPVGRTPTIQR
ncbi:MAG TPA: DUF3048 domain-containing protein [Mycobacteriales bacterium]|nr:DUF3048 domain-containing protein [Mycobacteriales bacterium]